MLTYRQKHCLQGIGIRQWVDRSSASQPPIDQEPAAEIEAAREPIKPASVAIAAPTKAPVPRSKPELEPVVNIIPKIEFNLDSWDNINQSIVQCENFNLVSGCTQKVSGVGNRHADSMIIGDGPGQEEDMNGESVVARSGVFLVIILH